MRDPGSVLKATYDAFEAKLAARPDLELPRRRFIHTGELVHDAAQFAVWANSGPYAGMPGSRIAGYQASTGGYTAFSQDVMVSICRDVWKVDNAGLIPSEKQLTDGAMLAAADAAALSEAFFIAMAENLIAGECDVANFGGVSFIGPQGGILETRLQFGLQL